MDGDGSSWQKLSDRDYPLLVALGSALDGIRINRLEIREHTHSQRRDGWQRAIALYPSCSGSRESLIKHGLVRHENLDGLPPCGVQRPRQEVPAGHLYRVKRGTTGFRVELWLSEEKMLALAGAYTVAPLWRQISGSRAGQEKRAG